MTYSATKNALIIPVYNEEESLPLVLNSISKELFSQIIVVNNGSTDSSAEVAKHHGAQVENEPIRGYGKACLKGISALGNDIEVIVFIDGDYSDNPKEAKDLLEKISTENYDLVIGSRILGNAEKGSLTPQQVFGNWLATKLISLFWGVHFSDLGPFRAITKEAYNKLLMDDEDFGWTVQMQIRAAKLELKVTEIPVSYKKRIGKSKISGTVKGVFLAGKKILYTIFYEKFFRK